MDISLTSKTGTVVLNQQPAQIVDSSGTALTPTTHLRSQSLVRLTRSLYAYGGDSNYSSLTDDSNNLTVNQATLTPSITAKGRRPPDGGTKVTLATATVATTFGSDVVNLEVGAPAASS